MSSFYMVFMTNILQSTYLCCTDTNTPHKYMIHGHSKILKSRHDVWAWHARPTCVWYGMASCRSVHAT